MSKHQVRVTTSEPVVVYTIDGSVLVCVQPDEDAWLRFRTVASYRAFREHLDRAEASHDMAAIVEFEAERNSYHAKMQSLRVERIALSEPDGAA